MLLAQRRPQLPPRRSEIGFLVIVEAAEDLPHPPHLAADVFELPKHGLCGLAVLGEVCPAGVGNGVELLGPFGRDARIAHLLEPRERRIDHPRTRAVEASGALLERLDELVPVTGTLR